MTSEDHHDFRPAPRRRGGRQVLFAGVAGACVLGAGLGLWARPSMGERQAVVKLAAAPAAAIRQLQIVVEDGPAPLGAPIEVLSSASVPARPTRPASDAAAPARPPQGLVRVEALGPPPTVATLKPALGSPVADRLAVKKAAPPTPARLAPKLQVAKTRPPAAPVRLAKAPAPSAKPGHKVEMARAQAVKAAVRRIELARAAAAKAAAHKLELARADTRAKAAKAAKAARQEQLRLAQAEARGRAEARAEARAEVLAQARAAARARVQLAKLARAPARAAPARTKAHVSPVELARFDRKARPRREPPVQHVPVKARKTPRAVEPAYRRAPASMAPQPSPTGLMKVSTTPHCGGAHPCVDPALGAAERQLARAYQGARAAGVPDAQLQRQQQRWLAARSAAAREAPWAVRDVYLARIAELNGLAHDAKSDGY